VSDLEILIEWVDELMVKARAEAEHTPTRENWNAVTCLVDAADRLFSAKAWQARQEGSLTH
jgi:hypothetical protein